MELTRVACRNFTARCHPKSEELPTSQDLTFRCFIDKPDPTVFRQANMDFGVQDRNSLPSKPGSIISWNSIIRIWSCAKQNKSWGWPHAVLLKVGKVGTCQCFLNEQIAPRNSFVAWNSAKSKTAAGSKGWLTSTGLSLSEKCGWDKVRASVPGDAVLLGVPGVVDVTGVLAAGAKFKFLYFSFSESTLSFKSANLLLWVPELRLSVTAPGILKWQNETIFCSVQTRNDFTIIS